MIQLTVTELRSQLLDVIRRVEAGEAEVIVTRHGRRVARIAAMDTRPAELLDVDAGRVRMADGDDRLLSTDEVWEQQ